MIIYCTICYSFRALSERECNLRSPWLYASTCTDRRRLSQAVMHVGVQRGGGEQEVMTVGPQAHDRLAHADISDDVSHAAA